MSTIRHAVFWGRVQGVGFRAFVVFEATARGVEGWVRNRRAGAVEAVFAGEASVVDAVIDACRTGPGHARVDAVDIRAGTADELEMRGRERFIQLPTV